MIALSRRDFLRLTGLAGATLVLEVLPGGLVRFASAAPESDAPFAPSEWLTISPDGTITAYVGQTEMGQGVRTSLPVLLAEELEVDPSALRIVTAEPGARYPGMRTSGSSSVMDGWVALRRAGATARTLLIGAAAARWGVAADACRAEAGAVVHAPTGRKLAYGELTAAAQQLPIPKSVTLKTAFTRIGQPTKRLDGPAIVTGRAQYGLDMRVPGMKFATIERAPTFGATLATLDDKPALAVPGVRNVVRLSNGVAVVADSTWAALQGRAALAATWTPGADAAFDSRALRTRMAEATKETGLVSRDEGGAEAAFTGAAQKFEALYEYGFHAHAPLEPMNAIAEAKADACTVWVGTQAPNQVQDEIAKRFGYAPEKVRVVVALIGGGFGRRLGTDYALEAVELSRALGGPVQVMWTRADDMQHGFFQPASANRMRAALAPNGQIASWLHTQAALPHNYRRPIDTSDPDFAGDNLWGAHDNPYALPVQRTAYVPIDAPMKRGPWRAVFYPTGVFARECFLDELAHAARKDPLEYRLALLEGGTTKEQIAARASLRKVLQRAADHAGWGKTLPSGHGLGIAANIYHGMTTMAQIAEVSVGADGAVVVHRFVCAVDCGRVINPLGVTGQVESAIVWGLSGSICGEITFAKGKAEQANFVDYPILRFDQSPVIEVLLEEGVPFPLGIGEQPVAPVAAAVGNAIFAATGKRVRRLPIRPTDLI